MKHHYTEKQVNLFMWTIDDKEISRLTVAQTKPHPTEGWKHRVLCTGRFETLVPLYNAIRRQMGIPC